MCLNCQKIPSVKDTNPDMGHGTRAHRHGHVVTHIVIKLFNGYCQRHQLTKTHIHTPTATLLHPHPHTHASMELKVFGPFCCCVLLCCFSPLLQFFE